VSKQAVFPEGAAKPIGPYSPAVKAGGFLFTSGQIAIDPATGDSIKGDIEKEAVQVMENLKSLVESAGVSMGDVVKTTCYLADIKKVPVFNEVYKKYFPQDNYPARSTIQAGALPAGFSVEVDAIAEL
jgi:2-iminobutanoate/2-iminopropanoate deaminase